MSSRRANECGLRARESTKRVLNVKDAVYISQHGVERVLYLSSEWGHPELFHKIILPNLL